MFKRLQQLHVSQVFHGQCADAAAYPLCDDLEGLRKQVLALVTPDTGPYYSGQAVFRVTMADRLASQKDWPDYAQVAEQLRSDGLITDIIHIGIGGSYLGPKLVHDVLNRADTVGPRVHFLANIDADGINELIATLNPQTTAVVIVSKSFGTLEAMLNATAVVAWMQNSHIYCVTSSEAKARTQFAKAVVFDLPAEIGGRYSVWTAVSFALIARFGAQAYAEFVQGGATVDRLLMDGKTTLPLELGFGDYQAQCHDAHDHVLIPYATRMKLLPDYCQQLSMESLGKAGSRSNGEVIFGEVGTLYQHSFQQLLMQGRFDNQVDVLLSLDGTADAERQRWLLANGLAQVKALATRAQNNAAGPINLLVCDVFDARILGEILALYEYRVITQAVLMQINPFDQPGVEAAKVASREVVEQLPDQVTLGDLERVLG